MFPSMTIGRYRLIERIGEGGMGEVWKAHDARLDRTVAIKMLPRGARGDDTSLERFRREALTLSRLSHSGIATVFDFDSAGDHDFLVMEFVAGGTLESRLRQGPLPLDEVRSIGIAVADALEDATAACARTGSRSRGCACVNRGDPDAHRGSAGRNQLPAAGHRAQSRIGHRAQRAGAGVVLLRAP